jgi:hypothetical protein
MHVQVAKIKEAAAQVAKGGQEGLNAFRALLQSQANQDSTRDASDALDLAFDAPDLGLVLLAYAQQVNAALLRLMRIPVVCCDCVVSLDYRS